MSNRTSDKSTSAVFVSYSRRDAEIADRLVEALVAAGRDVWLDKGAIPDLAEWKQEIREGIDKSDAVIFLLSPEFCASTECQAELEQAAEKGKRLVPVRVRDVDPAAVAPILASINWIDIAADTSLDDGFAQILRALDADLEWVKLHTSVTRRLAQHEQRGGDASLLLRGRQLSELEAAFATAEGKDPRPTDAQRRFLAESRRVANRRQRLAIGALATGLIVSIALGTLAYFQRNAAREARDEARQRYYASQIQLARNQAEAEPNLAFATLRDTARKAGELREFTWDLLSDKVARKIFTVGDVLDTTRIDRAFAIALSADGRRLAVAGKRRSMPGEEGRAISEIYVWDVDTGALANRVEVAALRTVSLDVVNSLALSHNGALLAAWRQGAVEVWDIDTGERLMSQRAGSGQDAVRFPPSDPVDGEVPALLLVGKGMVRMWPRIGDEPAEIRPLDTIRAFEFREDGRGLRLLGRKNVFTLDFATREIAPTGPDQRLVFSADDIPALPHRLLGHDYGTLEIIERDRETGAWARAAVLRGGHSSFLSRTRLSADGRWAVTAGGDNKVAVWDLAARRRALVLDGLRGEALKLDISRDGRRIAAADDAGALIVWEAGDGIVLPDIRRDRSDSDRCVRATSGGQVLSAVDGGAVLHGVRGTRRMLETGGAIRSCALSPRGSIAVLMLEEGGALIWETGTGRTVMLDGDHGQAGFVVSPDEATLAGWVDGRLTLRELPSGAVRAEIGEAVGTGRSIAFLDAGRLLARKTTGDGEVALVIDVDAGMILRGIALPERLSNLAVCPARQLMAATFRHRAAVYDLTHGSVSEPFAWTSAFDLGRPILDPLALEFTPDCTALAIGDQSGRLAVWRLADRAPQIDISANSGMTVVTHSFGGGSRQAGYQTRVIGRGVMAAAISPDGRTIATGGGTEAGVGELRLWDAKSGLLLAELPAEAGLVTGLAFARDGTRLVVTMDPEPGTRSGRIVDVWDARARVPFAVMNAHGAPVARLRRTADGLIESVSADPADPPRRWHVGPEGLRPAPAPLWAGLVASLPDWLWPREEPAMARPVVDPSPDGTVALTAPGWAEPVRVPDTREPPSIFNALAAVRAGDGVVTLHFLGQQTSEKSHGLVTRSRSPDIPPRLTEVHEPMIVVRDIAEIPETGRFALAGSSATPNDSTGVLRIWESAIPAPVVSFVGHQRRLTAMLLVPEAAIIVTGDEAGMIHAWPLVPPDPHALEVSG